jgi:hypothetical protein
LLYPSRKSSRHLPTLTATSESTEAGNPAAWKQLLLDFADDHPEHRDYIISRVNAIEPDKDTQLNMLAALIKEEEGLIEQHLANLDVEFKDEHLRCEARDLLETMRCRTTSKTNS